MDNNTAPLRLTLDHDALVANWRWLKGQGGDADCGAAIKADGYGLGAREVMARLYEAGCRDFYVSTWAEAAALMPLPEGATLSVLHGIRDEDLTLAAAVNARPVLNTLPQVRRWVPNFPDRPCDVKFDTGMNRLGLAAEDRKDEALATLNIAVVMSHLACADEDSAMNARQLKDFTEIAQSFPEARKSLANSAGICLGRDYAFDLTRPGLALYGGIPRREAADHIRPVVQPEAQILQVRAVAAGDTVGYGATYTATAPMRVGIINMGYADGIFRMLGPLLTASLAGRDCAVLGRVSMDLIAVTLPVDAKEGDWVALGYDLPALAAGTDLSQYELLTGLGARWDRVWR